MNLRSLAVATEGLKIPGTGVRYLRPHHDIFTTFSGYERRALSMLMTVLTGMYATGQTTWTRALLTFWQELEYLQEVTNRPIRDGEEDGEFQHFVTTDLFHTMRRGGELILPRARRRGGVEKLTGYRVQDVKRLVVKGKPFLTNINVAALARKIDELTIVPVPCIITTATEPHHKVFMEMRGMDPATVEGIGFYGLHLPEGARVSGIIPLQSELYPDVVNWSEELRLPAVINWSLERLKNPPTPLEQEVLGARVRRARWKILEQVLFREGLSRNASNRSPWKWMIKEGNRLEAGNL